MSGDLTLTQDFFYTKLEIKGSSAIFYATCFQTGERSIDVFRLDHISRAHRESRFLNLTLLGSQTVSLQCEGSWVAVGFQETLITRMSNMELEADGNT